MKFYAAIFPRPGALAASLLLLALLPRGAAIAAPREPILAERAAPETFPVARLDSLLGGPDPKRAAVALVFLAAECPLSRAALPALDAFAARYSKEGAPRIALRGVVPRETTGSPALKAMRREQGIRFPLLGDPDLALAKALGARVTPEVVLLDSAGRVLYRGAIDDRAGDLRRKRPRATRVHLDSAAAQWGAGRPVEPAATRAVGCFIE
jgi:hypothetical protein